MKRFTLAFVCLALASLAFSQAVQQEGLQIGPNMVEITARHADGTVFYHYVSHNLKTLGGIDLIASQIANTSSPAATSNYIALSTDSTAPSQNDCGAGSSSCTLTSEITTNGLGRQKASYSHTNGQATLALSYTFTDTTGATSNIQKAAVFNASTSGTMTFENTFTPVSLNVGDQLQLTWTITLS